MSIFVDRVDERIVSPHPICGLLKGAEQLNLKGNGCKGIIELLRREGFGNIKSLQMDGLDSLELIYDRPPRPVEFFSKLEYLSVYELNMLMYLWKGPNQKFRLSNLKGVKISECRNLKWVFPMSIAESLCELGSIEVSNCPMMEGVFKDEKESEISVATMNHLKFPNLKTIKLGGLPMCNGVDAVIECPSMERLDVDEVSLQKVFGRQLEQVKCTKLKVLKMWKLDIEIFYIVGGLINLRSLILRDCRMLEDIVKIEEGETIVGSSSSILSIFSQLYELHLSELPKIHHFCPLIGNALEFPSLERVIIIDCPMMETFAGDQHASCSSSGSIQARSFLDKQVTCPKLKVLWLEGLKVSGLLFSPEIPIASLNALSSLNIGCCHNLNNLFTSRMFGGLTSLSRLIVRNCSMLEKVIGNKQDEEDVDNDDELLVLSLPKLRGLTLEELPKLCGFSHHNLELSSLKEIRIVNCSETIKGISDPEFASQFFFHTEHHQGEDSLDNGSVMLLQAVLSYLWGLECVPSYLRPRNAFFVDDHEWKKVCGKFDMKKLSPGITYEITFVIKLLHTPRYRQDDQLETILADDERKYKVKDMPIKQWIEILAGQSSGQCGEIAFSLQKSNRRTFVAVKGVIIRAKENVA